MSVWRSAERLMKAQLATMSDNGNRYDRVKLPLSGFVTSLDPVTRTIISNGPGTIRGGGERVMRHVSQSYTFKVADSLKDSEGRCSWSLLGIHDCAARTCLEIIIATHEGTSTFPRAGWLRQVDGEIVLRIPRTVLPLDEDEEFQVAILYVRQDAATERPALRSGGHTAVELTEMLGLGHLDRPDLAAASSEALRMCGDNGVAPQEKMPEPRESDRRLYPTAAERSPIGDEAAHAWDGHKWVLVTDLSRAASVASEAAAETRHQRKLVAQERAKREELERRIEEMTNYRPPEGGDVGKFGRSIDDNEEEGSVSDEAPGESSNEGGPAVSGRAEPGGSVAGKVQREEHGGEQDEPDRRRTGEVGEGQEEEGR